MNELQLKINNITNILASDLPKHQKALSALQQFSGLDITHFCKAAKRSINKHLGAVNEIVSHYPTISDNNYHIISDKHLNDMLKNIQLLCLNLLAAELTSE